MMEASLATGQFRSRIPRISEWDEFSQKTIREIRPIRIIRDKNHCFNVHSPRVSGSQEASDLLKKVTTQFELLSGDLQSISQGDREKGKLTGWAKFVKVYLGVQNTHKGKREQLFDTIGGIQKANPDADPEQVMEDVLRAQQRLRCIS